MAKKYEKYVKRLNFRKSMGGTPARYKVYMEAADLNGIEVNFVIGVYEIMGLWAPKRGYKDKVDREFEPKPCAHAHNFPEILMFFGYGEDGLSNLGAVLNLALGKEWEEQIISEPSLVVLPPELPHCPLYTQELKRPFAHMHIALSTDHGLKGATTLVDREGSSSGDKYSRLVKKFRQGEKPAGAVEGTTFTGKDLEGIPLTVTMGLYNREGSWHPGRGAQVSPYDKLLLFFGNNAGNPNDLGAELRVSLGSEGEAYLFQEASVIIVPEGLPHMPVDCLRLNRPYYAVQIEFSPRPDNQWL